MRRLGAFLWCALALISANDAALGATISHRESAAHPVVRPLVLPTVQVPRRAVITFTVPEKTPPDSGVPNLPKAVGDYYAAYLPALRQGWVNMRDPGSTQGWPAQFPLIGSPRFPDLLPHHRYRMLVAVERPGKVLMPFPMRVLAVRPTAFRVAATIHPLGQPPVTPIALGAAEDPLGGLPITSTGIALDWANEISPIDSTQGDACPASSPVGSLHCPPGNLSTFVTSDQGFGGSVTPLQVVIGEGFNHPVSAPYISAYGGNLPTPFNAATIVGFGIDPPG